MADTISIRFIRESDLDAFKALRLEALRDYPTAFGTDYQEDLRHPDSVWVERVKGWIDNPCACLVVADDGSGLAGMLGVFRNDRVKTRHSATIWGVYLRPQYRGQKVIERMMDQALDWCRAKEVRIVRLTVTSRNVPAIRCYLKYGFAVYGVSPEEIRIGDTYHDELLMWRRV